MATTTTTTAANLLTSRWAKEIARAANEEAMLRPYLMDYGKLENTLYLPKIAAITPTTGISSFTGWTYTANTEDRVQVTPSTSFSGVEINANVDWQTRYEIHSPYRAQLVAGHAQQFDTDLAALASGFSNTVGSAATDIDEALLLSAKRVLMTFAKEHYKVGETPACLLIHPVQSDHIQSINNLMQANVRGDDANPLVGGWARIGLGFQIKESGVVKQSAGTTYNWLFVKTAGGIGFNSSPEIEVRVQEYEGVTRIIVLSNYGTAELWDGDGVGILSTTTA